MPPYRHLKVLKITFYKGIYTTQIITSSTKVIIKALYFWNYHGTNRTINEMKKKHHIAQ